MARCLATSMPKPILRRLTILRVTSILLGGLVIPTLSSGADASKPNVLLIIADDLGYNDVGFQGSKDIPTPNLDRLAARSLRCTSGYAPHSFCSPTRAAVLTGRYQHRFGHENNPAWLPQSKEAGLSLKEVTWPSLMKRLGYRTAAIGKWHLGAHPQFHPNRRGFDHYFGALGGGHVYFPQDKGGVEYKIPLDRNGRPEPQKDYLTSQFGEEACAFIQQQDKTPWMLYLAFNAPHTPLSAPKPWLDKLTHIIEPSRRTYAAMVAAMDESIGQVLATIESKGQTANTLVFFMSDNGGPDLSAKTGVNFTNNSPLRGAKGQLYEGGIRVPMLISWPARLKAGTYTHAVSGMDFLLTSMAAAGGESQAPAYLDSVNLLPSLEGKTQDAPHPHLFFRMNGLKGLYALRQGPWKLLHQPGGIQELYHLDQDPGETRNLASADPTRLQQMIEATRHWAAGTVDPTFQSPKGNPVQKSRP